MLKDGKFRYTLQFSPDSAEEITAGRLLDRLGRRKSIVIVKALNEYLRSHPELAEEIPAEETPVLQVQFNGIPMDVIEQKIRELVDQRISEVRSEKTEEPDTQTQSEPPGQISDDILEMLGDLDLFQ